MSTVENETATVEHETTTEETAGEYAKATEPSNDIAELRSKIEDQSKTINALQGRLERQTKKTERTKLETPEKTKTEEFGLLQQAFLRAAGVHEADEIELVRELQQKTGVDWGKVLDDDYVKHRLEGLREKKANEMATASVKGDGSPSNIKATTEYWQGKGERPTPDQVPDRKTRAKIIREMAASEKSDGKVFYND